ncbi:hypothetical protein E2562_013938 [Oryza meyeriana var. granulata]|uniref:Uncharacterized protein n=1 Tax=Oryza meyeriana var. granulata TaxID=110450 RepID=A0A6G1C6J1_9ORYZ|nr:hypothetical protein E2562_013938 [Oryza meyeriana var. granulata]
MALGCLLKGLKAQLESSSGSRESCRHRDLCAPQVAAEGEARSVRRWRCEEAAVRQREDVVARWWKETAARGGVDGAAAAVRGDRGGVGAGIVTLRRLVLIGNSLFA